MYKKYYNLLRILSVGIIALLLNTCGTKVDDYRGLSLELVEKNGAPLPNSVDLKPNEKVVDEKVVIDGKVEILTLSGEEQTGMNSNESVILQAKTVFSCSITVKVSTNSANNFYESAWEWYSSDPEIAELKLDRVDVEINEESGEEFGENTITGKKGGTATITVTGVNSEISASFTVTVDPVCGGNLDSGYIWKIEKIEPDDDKDIGDIVEFEDSYTADINCTKMDKGCCSIKGKGVDGKITITAKGNKSELEGTLDMGIGCIVMVEAVDHSGTVNIGVANGIDYNTIPDNGIEYKMVLTNCGNFKEYEWTCDDCKPEDDITLDITNNEDGTATIKPLPNGTNDINDSTERKFTITATAYKTAETMVFDPDNDKKATGDLNVARLLVDKEWMDNHTGKFILIFAKGALPDKIIPGAIQFKPPAELSDSNSVLLPESDLEKKIWKMTGISRNSNVVVYDSAEGLFGRGDIATYLLWVLDVLGHDITKLHLLNGQWRQWDEDSKTTGSKGYTTPTTGSEGYDGTLNESLNATKDFIKGNLYDSDYVFLATIGNYAGAGLFDFEFSDHHIPCAVQIDFDENLMTPLGLNDPDVNSNWRFRKPDKLLSEIYGDITKDKTIVTY